MNRTGLCIKMLQLLKVNGMLKMAEIGRYLEVSPRQVKAFKEELENVGYRFGSIPGPNGGIYLQEDELVPNMKLTDEEIKIILDGTKYINSRNDVPFRKEFIDAISKVLSANDIDEQGDDITIINRYPLVMSRDEIKTRYYILDYARKALTKVQISYLSQKNILKCHIVHPYKIFMYNNAWFMIAWNETVSDVGTFKINRIESFEILKDSFTILKTYKESDYINEYGFVENGKWYTVEFKALNQYASIVKERIYGKKQIVERIDEKTTYVKVDMQNMENIKSFLLGFGANIIILGPDEVKDKIKEDLDVMLQMI